MKNKNIIRVLIVTALLLTIPLIAMQFTNEVVWTLSDFIIAAALLLGTGLSYEFIISKSGNLAYRVAVGIAVGTALLLTWMNLAVGLIGNENNPANLMYIGVVAIELIGVAISRFKPRGMMRALFATAFAQAMVPVIAIIIRKPEINLGVVQVIILNSFFVMLFVGSALLFRHASDTEKETH